MPKIYQTVCKNPPNGEKYTYPIFSKRIVKDKSIVSEPWLADGYYFWESFISNAEYWGKTHCDGNYDIYCGEYDLNDPKCLNLVDNPVCIELIEQAYKTFIEEKSRKPKYLCQVIYFLRKGNKFKSRYDFIRVVADGGMSNGDSLHYAKDSYVLYSIVRQIQVCFWIIRNEIKNLTLYVEDCSEDNDEWLA